MTSRSLEEIERQIKALESEAEEVGLAEGIDQFWPNNIGRPWVPPVEASDESWLTGWKNWSTRFRRLRGMPIAGR